MLIDIATRRARQATFFAFSIMLAGIAENRACGQPADDTGRASRVRQLTSKSDAAQDDWQTEILHDHAKHQLQRLTEQLESALVDGADRGDSGIGQVFNLQASVERLRPDSEPSTSLGRFTVTRYQATEQHRQALLDPTTAVDELVRAFRRSEVSRFAFKIVAVEKIDEQRFATTVFYQGFGRNDKESVQQNATWQVRWSPGADEEHPLIESIKLDRFSQVSATASPFADCTGFILQHDDTWERQLRYGGDHWFGRVDAVGEYNFLGHEGIAIGDANGDGLDDVYVTTGSGIPNKLYLHQPDGTVLEMAHEAGVDWLDATKGALFLDLDNDGDEELICAMGPSLVYCRNDGAARFTPYRSLRAGSDAAFYSLAAADFDVDGDLDVYACRYVKVRYGVSVPVPFYDANNGPPNHLLRNDGEGGFTDVTHATGLAVNNARFSLAASWADYDNDGDPDLYVANDFGRNNLYRNEGGHFVDVAAAAGVEDQAAGMGVAWADFDSDGDVDLHVSNMFSSAGQRIAYQPRFKSTRPVTERWQTQKLALGNSLFANNGGGRFDDVSDEAGIRMGRWSWGAKFVDIDNDGFDDLVVPNGFLTNEAKDDL